MPVAGAAKAYVAELGHYVAGRKWAPLAKSKAASTPPDAPSAETEVRFQTVPVDAPLPQLVEQAPLPLKKNGVPVEAVSQSPPSMWTPERERALAELIQRDLERHQRSGSLEIAELLRRKRREEVSPAPAPTVPAAQGVAPPGGAVSSAEMPFGAGERPPEFWRSVNAELVIYGATAPDAAVTMGGHKIQLRPDGTFSFRFALPDGIFQLPVEAVSADGRDERRAELGFSRTTLCHSEVLEHPQDPQLTPPHTENVP